MYVWNFFAVLVVVSKSAEKSKHSSWSSFGSPGGKGALDHLVVMSMHSAFCGILVYLKKRASNSNGDTIEDIQEDSVRYLFNYITCTLLSVFYRDPDHIL